MPPLALYLHWPFCLSKCPYCDFNSHVRDAVDQDAWRAALLREIDHYAELLPGREIASIFFGGGTPSLMSPATVGALIDRAARRWTFAPGIEITLEANPTSVEAGNFAALAQAGVNRLSLGIQALDDEALRFLGRTHDSAQALGAITLAARHFARHSFDLIYAYAGQEDAAWRATLARALSLTNGHLSLYQLTIEQNTAFHTRAGRGELLTLDENRAAAMFELTQELMQAAGLPAYEISNHAARGQESRHNLAYWRYEDFIGIGPGAHGRYVGPDGVRLASVAHKTPEAWLAQVTATGHGVKDLTPVENARAQEEALMMGLRLTAGLDRAVWRTKFGADVTALIPPAKLQRLQDENLLRLDDARLAATPAGAIRLNAVLRYLAG